MSSIVKLPNGYRALVTVNCVRKTKCFPSKREAQQWAAMTETMLRQKEKLPVSQRFTLAEVMNRYSEEVSIKKRTGSREQLRIEALKAQLPAHLPIGDITPDHLGKWRDKRLKEVQAGSVLRDFNILSPIFQTAMTEWGLIDKNPCSLTKRPRAPDHREVLLTRRQIILMLKALGYGKKVSTITEAVGVAFLLALRTGMRAGEICDLRWDQVNRDYLSRVGTKTGARDVPAPPKVMRLISKMKHFDKDKVFPLKTSTLDALFRKHRNKVGLSGFTFHDSRHYAATMLCRKVDALTLCKIFGWKNPKFALIYYNPTASDIANRLK